MPFNPDIVRSLGFSLDGDIAPERRTHILRCIHLQLLAMGLPADFPSADAATLAVASSLLARYKQKTRLLEDYRCPADRRIESFLASHLADLKLGFTPRLPGQTFILDQHGVARELSLPLGEDKHLSPLVSSYRVRNGVLHNPKSDRRTTKGTFHVAEGGLAIPDDKVAVPRPVFAEMLRRAVVPPTDLMVLPFTAKWSKPAEVFVSLLLRPLVCPEVPGSSPARHMEVRFFVPGSLVSNLDFVESIFGNAGDPMLPENDAALDIESWTRHTGCVILAPHLIECTKKELGLPHIDKATTRQKRDGQCWSTADEKYNGGDAFKLTCRTDEGVIVTLIADNYFGYCKKEVKTQISYAANLFGNAEEEHAGGAMVFPSYALGDEFRPVEKFSNGRTFEQVAKDYAAWMNVFPSGYGVDKRYPNVIYIAEDACLNVRTLQVTWSKKGEAQSLPLLLDHIYVTPSGQKIFVNKHPGSGRFRLVVTAGEGTLCHKPCTVSGGGKSEISKSLDDYMIYGPVYVGDLQKDLDQVEKLLKTDYSKRWKADKSPQDYSITPSRPLLGDARSLGSVIKLLTPSPDYTDQFNQWLESIPSDILSLLLLIKRLYRPEWGDNWREHFTVDVINGEPGHELKIDDRKAAGVYLRVGLLANQTWRNFRLRQDFFPAQKVQLEDDITASTVVPASWLADQKIPNGRSIKLVRNCEYRLFQRPDDAIHPGFDKQAESDIARRDNFLSNYEPLAPLQAGEIARNISFFDRFTPPMKQMVLDGSKQPGGFVVCSANPRVIDGKTSKNPRYLQTRLDLLHPLPAYVAEMGLRLARAIPADKPVVSPVDAVLFGRRNNPPEPGVRSLAVFNPIHYQEVPELFMEFICSLTGKSPSTTGAGSEGALTKGPFNALLPIIDLNTALVSFILTGLGGFSTAAGYVGPKTRVDHDLSLMIPELWCRMRAEQRDPNYLIENGYLEKLEDFEHGGKKVLASRLGYRITYNFVRAFFGRLFANPNRVFDTAMLKPETQDMDVYVDGILNITEAQQRVARHYFEDGSVELACPPLRALLHIMAEGRYEGRGGADPEIRRMFTREYLLKSDWYAARLVKKQERGRALWQRHVASLAEFIADDGNAAYVEQNGLRARLDFARSQLDYISSPQYVGKIVGTVGADPMKAMRG